MSGPALQAIEAETQIFTPAYVAKFLAENSIARIWMNSRPHSSLADRLGYWVACDDPPGMVTVDGPEEIRVLDPACGTGNLLVAAFDVLYAIYEDAGYAPTVIPELILAKNLFGLDIDPHAAAAASAILTAKAHERHSHFYRSRVVPNVRALTAEDHRDAGLFGALIRSINVGDYHVIIANPPYMGSKHFTPPMRAFAKREYPDSGRDLAVMFIERALELLIPGGLNAMITPQTWMFLGSYEKLRRRLVREAPIITMAHLGEGVFGRGAVISTTAFVHINAPNDAWPGTYFRLVDSPGRSKQRDMQSSILAYRLERTMRGSPREAGAAVRVAPNSLNPASKRSRQLGLFGSREAQGVDGKGQP